MAGYQPARSAVGESVAEFMERRRREVAQLGHDAEAAGHEAWAAATRAEESLVAATPRDVLALGAGILDRRASREVTMARPIAGPSQMRAPRSAMVAGTATSHAARHSSGTVEYGALRANLPSDQELAELRRQQAAFAKTARQIDIQNSWFAAPALAAPLAVMGLEAAGGWILGEAAPGVEQGVANFLGREPYVRGGDNWATRAGRRAHAVLKERVSQKPGWESEPAVQLPKGRIGRPDVRTQPRVRRAGEGPKPFQMELKPNTPTGRQAAARAVKKYGAGDVKTRPIFYDPKPFI